MEQTSRDRLAEKRRLLQLRRQRGEEARTYRTVAEVLCARGVARFCKIPPVECQRIAGRFSHRPGEDERFLWPDSERRVWRERDERDLLFRRALLACCNLEGSVAVLYHSHEAGIRIAAAALADHCGAILDPVYGAVWVTSYEPSPWLIEVARQDDEVCYTLQA